MCSRMDCILGPHWSQRPLATRTTESAVRSLSPKTASVQQVDARYPLLVGQVYEPHLVHELRGYVAEEGVHQVGVGIQDDDGVSASTRRPLPHLVDYHVVHEGGLAHAGPGYVEVVTLQQIIGKADFSSLPRSALAHQGALFGPLGGGHEGPGAGTGHQGACRHPPPAGATTQPPPSPPGRSGF